jgi:hypothetical protein
MTTLETWIRASLIIMKENLIICDELFEKGQIDLLWEQTKSFKKHLDSFIEFLERQKKFN